MSSHSDPFIGSDGGVQFSVGTSPATVIGGSCGGGGLFGAQTPTKKQQACNVVHHATGLKDDTNVKMVTGGVIALAAFFLGRFIFNKLLRVNVKLRR
jgi:hypothetical protein